MTKRESIPTHAGEPHNAGLAARLNWLRAGVLGANDGIVSVAAVVVGVAGATSDLGPIVTAGSAAVIGGAISMALGEYVSVSSARDNQRALIEKERAELAHDPDVELDELASIYEAKGLRAETARQVAAELTAHDPLEAHLEAELGIDADDLANPWHAAGASFLAFFLGSVLPMAAIILPPANIRVAVTIVAVLVALAVTGAVAARIGGAAILKPTLRVVIGGGLALAATFAVGSLLNASGVV